MATKPVPPPVPELVSAVSVRTRSFNIAFWGSTRRTIILLILLLVVAYVCDYYDDSYLQTANPIVVRAPEGGGDRWNAINAGALGVCCTVPDDRSDSESGSQFGGAGSTRASVINKAMAGSGLSADHRSGAAGTISDSAVDAAFGSSPY